MPLPSELSRSVSHDAPTVTGSALRVSVVVYRPDLAQLRETFETLHAALARARAAGVLRSAHVDLIDNGSDSAAETDATLSPLAAADGVSVACLRGHGNVGYGRGHNLGIHRGGADYHLVLNPDVRIDRDAIVRAIRYMEDNPGVGLLTPRVAGPDGELQRLCRRYPTVFVLFLRGFAPGSWRRRFRPVLDRYEMADTIGESEIRGVPLASGCFMFFRASALRAVGGFSPEYFLYFEDHDLSLRAAAAGDIAYVPAVRIVHYGGGAGRKGLRHVRLYVASAARFFSKHGWRLW